ncbi:Cmx/CmrA family chloramphenicol efflux MFS transporter [Brachybacterium phenoliresistens]|uniref:Cmx/CmrA family chloramphenicol efflux MFS transporter n=1 Tax=Brachybacterium phenoliresistens TaxID=396014 RepID=UPI0031DC8582
MPLVLFLLALAVFVMGTSEFMLAGLIPAIAADLDVPLGAAGLLTSAFAGGMVLGAPLMAVLARRWPPRSTLLACLLVFAGCHAVAALTPRFPILLGTRALSALACAGFLAVALSTATNLVPAHRTGRALAILLSGTTLATIAGVPAGALLGTAMGWRATFWAIALLCIPAALGVLAGMRRTPAPSARTAGPDLRSELAALGSSTLLRAMALAALVNAGTFAAFTYLAPVVTEVAGLADGWIPVALMAFGIGSFLGVTIAGRLSDRWPGPLLAVGGPMLLIGWVALALLASRPVLLLALVLVQGMVSFGVGSTLVARVLRAASGAPTMGGACATAALNIGAAAGPGLGALGLSADRGVLAPIWVAAGLTAAALTVMALSRPRRDGSATTGRPAGASPHRASRARG